MSLEHKIDTIFPIVPLQDVLGLGSECRMNRPGTLKGNWEWRLRPDQMTEDVGSRLKDLTGLFDRLPMTTSH